MPKDPQTKADVYHSERPPSEGGRTVHVHNKRAKASTVLSECDATILWAFVCSVLVNGDCVSITDTSDGGAVSFTLLSGGTRYKTYIAHPLELRMKLDALFDAAYTLRR